MRVPMLLSNSAITTLTTIRQQLDALKQKQPNNGYMVTTHLNQTANSYDHTATIASGSSNTFQVDFVANQQSYAICDLMVAMFRDSLSNPVPLWTGGYNFPITRQLASANPTIWFVKVPNNDVVSHVYYLKYTVQSTDSGTVRPL